MAQTGTGDSETTQIHAREISFGKGKDLASTDYPFSAGGTAVVPARHTEPASYATRLGFAVVADPPAVALPAQVGRSTRRWHLWETMLDAAQVGKVTFTISPAPRGRDARTEKEQTFG
jgi:hypothetical protein